MTINKQDISAVILAGGKGSRLGGQDKGLLLYQGKPLVEHIVERIQPQVDNILINANRNHDIYRAYGYPVINDTMQDYQGPLAGFSAAMQAIKTEYMITLPCDCPLIPNDLVARLIASLENNPLSIAVAHNGQRLQSVHALIPVKLQDSLNQFLATGNRKIALWYAQHHYIATDFSDIPQAFTNINTEEQRLNLDSVPILH
ncbi:MAG TPA: molybdenum cofactor guanylyltransferase [Leucothrix mucor]|uniref:Molybdenum cofactor guanylyltransferase n=1 Tax=Leucothrix mucor TaxID=45248 RepID=A0A7V2T2H5_LEUMU|nr:molybdenum cofactor guanylyltransferase [Leucothrix mucor]